LRIVLRQERIASAPSTIGDYRRRVCALSNAKECVISIVCNLFNCSNKLPS
jgi:hypothetical protein